MPYDLSQLALRIGVKRIIGAGLAEPLFIAVLGCKDTATKEVFAFAE